MPVFFKQYRQAKGLTQVDVANALNITYQAYSNYELGKREADYETLLKLSELFEVSIEALLTDKASDFNINANKMQENKEAAILKGSRRDFFDILNGLSENEFNEFENYVNYILWKRGHSVSELLSGS